MALDAVADGIAHDIGRTLAGTRRITFMGVDDLAAKAVVLADQWALVLPNQHGMARRKGTDSTVNCLRFRHMAPDEESGASSGTRPGIDLSAVDERLYRGGKPQCLSIVRVVKG